MKYDASLQVDFLALPFVVNKDDY